jgi:tRNA (adenine37-N6)-methyltransferase
MKYEVTQIGVIRSPYKGKDECPIQGAATPDGRGQVELFPEYEEGLKDIETFSHIILLYIFDRAGAVELIRTPFLDDSPHGIFATRHPCRPSGIGFSVVKLEGRNGNILDVAGIDVLDNTPLIDVKPYMPRFDHFDGAGNGWAETKELRPKPAGRE